MTKTVSDLSTAVLRHLRVADAVDDADSADITLVQDAYQSLWEELSAHGHELTYWHYEAIPLPVFLILRDLVSLEVQDSFGKVISPAERYQQREILLRRLRRHVHTASSGLQTKANYF